MAGWRGPARRLSCQEFFVSGPVLDLADVRLHRSAVKLCGPGSLIYTRRLSASTPDRTRPVCSYDGTLAEM